MLLIGCTIFGIIVLLLAVFHIAISSGHIYQYEKLRRVLYKGIDISVQEEDIRNGKPECIDGCPIALAIKRELGRYVSMHEVHVLPLINGTVFVFLASSKLFSCRVRLCSRNVAQFIDNFDYGKPVAPFTFHLCIANS